MPPFEEMDLRDPIVLWPAVGVDNYSEPIVGPPQDIDGRWVGTQSLALDPQGNTVVVDATAVVVQDIPLHSIMWKGSLSDLVGEAQFPLDDGGLMQIKTHNSADDVKGRFTRRTVGLMRFRGKLPRIKS